MWRHTPPPHEPVQAMAAPSSSPTPPIACHEASPAPAAPSMPARSLYVGNLPPGCGAHDVSLLFNPYGTLASLIILTSPATHPHSAAALVSYFRPGEAQAAMEALDGHVPPGHTGPLTVQFADGNAAKSPKSPDIAMTRHRPGPLSLSNGAADKAPAPSGAGLEGPLPPASAPGPCASSASPVLRPLPSGMWNMSAPPTPAAAQCFSTFLPVARASVDETPASPASSLGSSDCPELVGRTASQHTSPLSPLTKDGCYSLFPGFSPMRSVTSPAPPPPFSL